MAKQRIIDITVNPDGTTEIEPVEGYADGSCLKDTEKLQEALGGKVLEQKLKPEAHIPVSTTTKQKTRT